MRVVRGPSPWRPDSGSRQRCVFDELDVAGRETVYIEEKHMEL
ncbi:MAG TPA: hypothetical protein ACFCUC_19085 [Desulfobacterales bacterium]